jgi:hypothetical protein
MTSKTTTPGRPTFDWRRLIAMHVRRAPLAQVSAAAVVGGAAVVLRALYADTSRGVLQIARLSAVLVAAAAAVALENACVSVTGTTSLRRSASSWLSAGLCGAVALVLWVVPVLIARQIAGDPGGLPIGGLLIEFVALILVGWWLTEAVSALRGPSGAGNVAGISLTLAVVMTLMTPHTIDWLWRGPDPDWRVIHVRWAVIAAIATVLLAIGLRDAAAPWPSLRRVRTVHPGPDHRTGEAR